MDCSVVIPTRGRPHLLREAIDSVLGQSLPAREIIVVVDGPDQVSTALAAERGCVVVGHERPQGAGAARNTGLRTASGEWVAFLDDDDLWHPDRVRLTSGHLATHTDARAIDAGFWTFGPSGAGADLVAADLASCMHEVEEADSSWTDMAYLNIHGRSFELLLERNRGAISTATVERNLLVEVGGFPEGLTCAEDWLMFLAVAGRTEWHFLPDKRLAFVRRHAQSNTAHNPSNLVVSLRAIAGVWASLGGPHDPPHRPLSGYGKDYRWHVQQAIWAAVGRKDWAAARQAWLLGRDLLPRRTDRAYAGLPPAVTWRVEHRAWR